MNINTTPGFSEIFVVTERSGMMNEEKRLIQFGQRWDEAIVSNNAKEIGKCMSDDWVCVGSNGITTKSAFLGWIESGALTHNRMDSDEIRVKIYGNTGILSSRGTSAGTYNGVEFDLYEWQTSVFMKDKESWRCVLTMLTPAVKND